MNHDLDANDELVEIEAEFWRSAGDPDRYADRLAPDAVHVFPGWGVAQHDAVLDGVGEAPPWKRFTIDDPQVIRLGDDCAALVYEARASRPGQDGYSAAITSVYRRRDDGWELVVHQQTPLR